MSNQDNTPHITDELRKRILGERILQLEADLFTNELTIVEMSQVITEMPEAHKQTDAETAKKQAEVLVQVIQHRLTAMRTEWYRLFPDTPAPTGTVSPTE